MRLELQQDAALFPEAEPRVRFEVNADGERGSDVRGDDPGLFRVLVAGGSPAECFALDQPTSWPGALERLLNAKDNLRTRSASRAHVGNIGRGGIASEHLDVIFEHALPQYRQLGLIVVLVGGNDVFQWLEQGAPTSIPFSSVTAADVFQYEPWQPFGWMPRRCATIQLARRLRRSWLRPLEVRERAAAWVTTARNMRAQASELRTSVPDPAVMVDHFEHHFRRLLLRARAHADRVLVVRQPWFEKDYTPEEAGRLWHGGLGKAWKQAISVYYAQDILNCLMALVDARAAAVASELGVEHLDLRTVLEPSLENYYDLVHYTPRGAAVVAQTVAEAILRPTTLHAGTTSRAACGP
jgi:lysophospholipase L1-like esterase